VGALSAAGLGFLRNDLILLPFLALLLGLTLWGLERGVSRHGLRRVFIVGLVGAVLLVVSIFFHFLRPLLYAGMVAIIGASLWNIFALRQANQRRLRT
jgi:Flp pilus assembly protein TadB